MEAGNTTRKKTPERILDTALRMFNEEGEPNVTTNAISDEMDISPGNLHYHFKSKSDLVQALFERFDRQLSELLHSEAAQAPGLEQAWLQVLKLFELMWCHRFTYRDLSQLLLKYPAISQQTARLLHRKIAVAEQNSRMFGVPEDNGEADAMARNVVAIATYWFSFELACGVEGDDSKRFARGANQIAHLLLPYLDEESQLLLRQLAGDQL